MEIKYIAKNYKISDKLKEIIEKKLSKLEKYFNKDVEIKVACTEQNDKCKLEVTINSAGLFIRSEVTSDNMYNNIDLAMPKLERQIVKNNQKFKNKFAERSFDGLTAVCKGACHRAVGLATAIGTKIKEKSFRCFKRNDF